MSDVGFLVFFVCVREVFLRSLGLDVGTVVFLGSLVCTWVSGIYSLVWFLAIVIFFIGCSVSGHSLVCAWFSSTDLLALACLCWWFLLVLFYSNYCSLYKIIYIASQLHPSSLGPSYRDGVNPCIAPIPPLSLLRANIFNVHLIDNGQKREKFSNVRLDTTLQQCFESVQLYFLVTSPPHCMSILGTHSFNLVNKAVCQKRLAFT